MKKIDLAYTAGIIDGEGCINISRRQGKHQSTRLQVSVVNTNEWLCQWLKMQFGGIVRSRRAYKPNHKPSYSWQLGHKKASEFLRLILPYLNIKKPNAEIAIAYQERQHMGRATKGQKVLNEADRILMASFNKRGV